MKIAIILPACVLLCTAEPPIFPYKAFPKDAEYPISFQERVEPAGPGPIKSENGGGWGWKNKELKHADEGWGGDKLTETTSVPLILIPTEPEDSSEPAIIITNGPKARRADRDDDGTLQIFGGDAEKAKAVDWGSEGYKQLRTASTFESWKQSSTDATFLEEDPTNVPEIDLDNEGPLKAIKAGPSKGWGKASSKAQKASVGYEAKAQKAHHVKAQKAYHAKAQKADDYEFNAQAQKAHEFKAQRAHELKAQKAHELKAQKAHEFKAQKAHEFKARNSHEIKAQIAEDYEFKAHHHKAAHKAAAQKAAAYQAKALKAAAQKKGKKAEGVAKASEDYRVEAVYYKDY